jgi:hypothetical protein
LATFDHFRPRPVAFIPTVTDVGPVAPEVAIPGRRDAELVEPGPLSVLERPEAASFDVVARKEVPPGGRDLQTTGRRTALAQWIASPENPLPSRVLANRIWQHHFGRGLCESPSDFGRLGEPPTHPELLDYLASELLENDWSIKRLHRLMLSSAAYRRASQGPEVSEAAAKDPLNRFVARMTVRRLSAEQIRDAAVAASGELDPQSGGEAGDWKTSRRRAVYLKVLRNRQDPTLEVFDAPDGIFTTPVRNVTTTSTQSLFMINGPWTMERAKAFARRVGSDSSLTHEQRVAMVYALAYGRPPSEAEMQAAVQFLVTNSARSDEALVDLCHVVLNSNEFLYLD